MSEESSRIRVMVADDHALMRTGLMGLIDSEPDMKVVGEASDGESALACFRACLPDVTIVDLEMPKRDGVSVIEHARAEFPGARLIVLTMHVGDVQAMRALKAGASGYLVKTCVRAELIRAIRLVHAGHRYVPPDIAVALATHIGEESLSERERSVLALAASGAPNREIGVRLHISEDTVKGHMKRILAKLDARDRTQAVAIAIRRGILADQ